VLLDVQISAVVGLGNLSRELHPEDSQQPGRLQTDPAGVCGQGLQVVGEKERNRLTNRNGNGIFLLWIDMASGFFMSFSLVIPAV
jgi:hypothetical protein